MKRKCKLCEKKEVDHVTAFSSCMADIVMEENNLTFYGDDDAKYSFSCNYCPKCGKELVKGKNKPDKCNYCENIPIKGKGCYIKNDSAPILILIPNKKSSEEWENYGYEYRMKYCPICGKKLSWKTKS